jgi:hypothetical protein
MTTEERQDAYLWHQLSAMLAASNLGDVEPLSMAMRWDADTIIVTVRSRSRGPVAIGTIDSEQIDPGIAAVTDEQLAAFREHERDAKAFGFETMRAYAEDLEAIRRRPLEAKASKSEANIRRAVELREAGNSVPRIAQIMSDERRKKTDPRVANRWLATAKSRTDREPSV